MTRGTIRTRLQKELRDTAAIDFSVAELDDLINVAYSLVQKEIVKINASWHIVWDYINTEANESWYPVPPTFGIKYVHAKFNTSDTGYTQLNKVNFQDVETRLNHNGEVISPLPTNNVLQSRYCLEGQYIGIFPAPATVITNGIRVLHTPIMALADDDEVPKIKTPTHMAIVYWAKMLALGETEESSQYTEKRLLEILGDLAFWYEVRQDEADRLSVVK